MSPNLKAVNIIASSLLDVLNEIEPSPREAILAISYVLVDITIAFTLANEDELSEMVRGVFCDRIKDKEIH